MNRHLITACDQLQKISINVDPMQTAVTVAALFLLREYQPYHIETTRGSPTDH